MKSKIEPVLLGKDGDPLPDSFKKFTTAPVTSKAEVEEVLDIYSSTYEKYFDFDKQYFSFHLIYGIAGNLRTKVIENVTMASFLQALEEYEVQIETYNQGKEEIYTEEVSSYVGYVSLRLKPMLPKYGHGAGFYTSYIGDNKYFQKIFTKTTKHCVLISAIKFMEREYRGTTCSEMKKHKLYNHVERIGVNAVEKIENHYNKKVIITTKDEEIPKLMDNPDNIVLFSIGGHVGYVIEEYPVIEETFNGPTIVTTNTEVDDEPDEEEEVEKEIKVRDLLGILTMDCEFSLKEEIIEGDDDTGNNKKYVSEEPNLIVLRGIVDGKEQKYVHNSFKKAIIRLKFLSNLGPIHVFSTNGGKIEHQFILRTLIKHFNVANKTGMYELKNVSSTSIKSLKFGDNLTFFDSYLLMPMSVAQMSKAFDLPVEKGHKDWEKIENLDKGEWYKNKKWDSNNEDDVEYCENDCLIPYLALLKFNEKIKDHVKCIRYNLIGVGDWVLSNTSIASIGKQTIFRHFPYMIDTQKEKGLTQKWYYGGRCEAYHIGDIKSNEEMQIVEIDVNSAYPFHATNPLPCKIVKTLFDVESLDNLNEKCYGAYVMMSYNKKFKRLPGPLGMMRNNQLIFPNIENPTLVFLWDFQYFYLKKHINIHSIKAVYCMETMSLKCLFEPWYEMKRTATDPATRNSFKMLMNGSLGGLGLKQKQKGRSLVKDVERFSNDKNLTNYTYKEGFDGYYWVMYDQMIQAKTCFQAISYITAKQRLYVWLKMQDIIFRDKHNKLLYTDTDSIHAYVTKETAKYLKETANDELGGWDYEEYEVGYYRGLKKYYLDGIVKFNGLCKKNASKLSIEDLKGREVRSCEEKWKLNGNMNITIKDTDVIMSCEYTKGVVDQKTGTVTPLVI